MPDWTYHPLRPVATAVLGERRTQVLALRFLAMLITYAGGRRWIPVVFDHPEPPADWSGRFGISIPPWIAQDAITVLPVQGASVLEISPVRSTDLDVIRRATAGRRCRVTAVVDGPETADAIAADVDAVTVADAADTVRLTKPDIAAAVHALADPSATVLATPAVLLAVGPGWFNRVIEAATPTRPPEHLRDLAADPRRWPGWLWAALVGVGLIVAGIGAAVITLGPVLLPYDRSYLGASVSDLRHVNRHLIGFLIHDRITMAGNMIGIGILYLLLAQQLRQGFRWAQRALLVSGALAFGSYFYFLATGFVEPLHTLVVVTLFPMLVLAIWRGPSRPSWPATPDGPEGQRRRALWGQLLMIGVGGGLAVAGAVISTVGLTSVFVPTDLDFMGTHADHLRAADAHLLPFIAHDRAGFGGALIGAGLAILLISMWGWRRGQSWVWWSLLLGCGFGTVPVLIVHFAIGYTHFEHLAPVYILIAATTTALALSKSYLTAGTRRSTRGATLLLLSSAALVACQTQTAAPHSASDDDHQLRELYTTLVTAIGHHDTAAQIALTCAEYQPELQRRADADPILKIDFFGSPDSVRRLGVDAATDKFLTVLAPATRRSVQAVVESIINGDAAQYKTDIQRVEREGSSATLDRIDSIEINGDNATITGAFTVRIFSRPAEVVDASNHAVRQAGRWKDCTPPATKPR